MQEPVYTNYFTLPTNTLVTGTLTMEDIQNQAEYEVKGVGVSYTHYGTDEEKYKHYNESDLIPALLPGAEGKDSSITHSAIAPGSVTTTKEKMDLSKINRDTANALNKLDQIFDKKTIEEKQELARLVSKNGNELIHTVSERYGWKDGSANKVALHYILGGLTAKIASGNFKSGAWAAGINEELSKEILKLANGDPAKAQMYSAFVGAVVNSALNENGATGAVSAQYGTKYNLFAWTKPFIAPKLRELNRDILAKNQVYIVSLDVGEMVSGKVGFILDKFGNVYEVVGIQGSVSLLPGDASVGIATITIPEGDKVNSDDMKDILNGLSFGVNIEGGMGGGFSISITSEPKVSAEANISTNAGISAGFTHTEYIYNIDE